MKQRARALIGYMDEEEAIQLLTSNAADKEADVARARRIWRAAVEIASHSEEYENQDPTLAPPPAAAGRLNEIAQRGDIQSLLKPLEWSIGWADVSGIVSYQRIVKVEGAIDRVRGVAANDLDAVIEVCLPGPDKGQFQGAFDQAQLAFTASSMNPNLRVAGFQVAAVPTAGGHSEQLFGFKLTHGSSFVQLVEYKGRWLVRDGYHRIFGLMAQGVKQMPCVIVHARSFEETGAGRPGFFGYELLFGRRPPRVADFFSDASADIEIPAVMRVIRLRAEEFVVPIPNPDEPDRQS